MGGNGECVFCRIAAGRIPARFLFKDDHVMAFADINPQAPVHVLIAPVGHYPDVEAGAAAGGEVFARMFQAAARVAADLGVTAGGYRLVLNNGEGAGQIVPHAHLHLMAGREFGWPPG